MPNLEPTKVKFYRHALLPNENGCMIWSGALASRKGLNGYGKIRIKGGKTIAAHRFSYEMHNGKIPKGMFVLHKCDIPRCVAPEHLFLGTALDNIRDKVTKKRCNVKQGADNYNARFTNEDIKKIKALHKQGFYIRKIANMYKVTRNTIAKILNGESYKNV